MRMRPIVVGAIALASANPTMTAQTDATAGDTSAAGALTESSRKQAAWHCERGRGDGPRGDLESGGHDVDAPHSSQKQDACEQHCAERGEEKSSGDVGRAKTASAKQSELENGCGVSR